MVSLRLTKATSCPLYNIKSITANTHTRATIRWLLVVVGAVMGAVMGTDGYCSMGTALQHPSLLRCQSRFYSTNAPDSIW
jgi:hypothetical protein